MNLCNRGAKLKTLHGPIFPSATILRANIGSFLASQDYVTKTAIK